MPDVTYAPLRHSVTHLNIKHFGHNPADNYLGQVDAPALCARSWYLWMAQKSRAEFPARLRVSILKLPSPWLLFSLKVNSFFLI